VNVSLKRIAVYLDEVEVSEQVSSLKDAAETLRNDEPEIGYSNHPTLKKYFYRMIVS